MKTKIIILLIMLFVIKNSAQELTGPEGWALAEIFMITKGLTENDTDSMRYRMEAITDVWKADETSPFSNYKKTNDYNLAYYPKLKYKGVRNTPYSYYNTQNVLGFNFLFESQNEAPPRDMDSYGWGKYKLTAIYKSSNGEVTEKGSVFIDFIDCRYPGYPAPVNGHGTDIWIKFDASGYGQFSIRSTGPSSPSDFWEPINYNSCEYIWQLKAQSNYGSPLSS